MKQKAYKGTAMPKTSIEGRARDDLETSERSSWDPCPAGCVLPNTG